MELLPCRRYRPNKRGSFPKRRKRFFFNLFEKIKTSILFWCESAGTIICWGQISHLQRNWLWKRFGRIRQRIQNFRSWSLHLKLLLGKIPQTFPSRGNWKTCSKGCCCCLSAASQWFWKWNWFTWVCIWLSTKKPKIDFFKYVDNDKKVLRYTARFNTKVPEDVDRRFIISYYLADDTISIFEPAQKNSGIIEGPFLKRNKYKNVDKNLEFINPSDLAVGGDIKINGYNFHLFGCDEYTTKYLAIHTYEWITKNQVSNQQIFWKLL